MLRDNQDIATWIESHGINEVECLVPDMSGIMRGKIMSAEKFLNAHKRQGLRLPEAIFNQTVTGVFVDESDVLANTNLDVCMIPDLSTIRRIPWYSNPTAQVICDVVYMDGTEVDVSPRTVLRRVMRWCSENELEATVAPELEFYLVKRNTDPDLPLEVPTGLSGRAEAGTQAYGIEAVNEYDPVIDQIYAYCESSGLSVDTMAHEAGPGQVELNFDHGDPLELADQVFLFKRTVRQAAFKHGIYATFMAKPHAQYPGSSMHIHQSLSSTVSGRNIFATASGKNSQKLMQYIAGLQKYGPAAMPLFAANTNSYRRITPYSDAPINVHWGHDNRTVGLRVPPSDATNRRVENRVPGADANPYLAIAGTLACGLLGITQRKRHAKEVTGDAYRLAFALPRGQLEALSKLSHCKPLRTVLGERFVRCLNEVKLFEYRQFSAVISSWERENLLLNV